MKEPCRPMTMRECEEETQVRRDNITRYVANLFDSGKIQMVRKGTCPITGHVAGFYTTNKELFIKQKQLSFWDRWEDVEYD